MTAHRRCHRAEHHVGAGDLRAARMDRHRAARSRLRRYRRRRGEDRRPAFRRGHRRGRRLPRRPPDAAGGRPRASGEHGRGAAGPRGNRPATSRRSLPLATVVTPNLAEARVLAGIDGDRRTLAERIVARGAGAVLITGGEGEGSDLLFDGADHVEIPVEWVAGTATHGTGCTHSATLTAELALGTPLADAARRAAAVTAAAIEHGRRRHRQGRRAGCGWSGLRVQPARPDEVDEQADPEHVDEQRGSGRGSGRCRNRARSAA